MVEKGQKWRKKTVIWLRHLGKLFLNAKKIFQGHPKGEGGLKSCSRLKTP